MKLKEKIIRNKLEELLKEEAYLKGLFLKFKEAKTVQEHLEQYREEQDTLKKYHCKDSSEMITYLVELSDAISYLNTRIYFDFDSKR